jgi:simple sugar transport system ATP-binding protein
MTSTITADPEKTLPPELEIVNMTKKFGSIVALENVSLKMKPGAFQA